MDHLNKCLLVASIEYLEKLKEQLREASEALTKDMEKAGVGSLFQDEQTGIVYKIVKPSGSFVYYKDLDYVRTAKEGERSGSLSKKEAEENGFMLPSKK